MFQQYLFTCLVVLFGLLEITNGKSSGFKARITSNGLNYANRVAMDALAAKIRTFSVPDQHGNSGGVSYDLTNLQVNGFTEPQSSIVFLPGSGLQWTANGAGISMHGDFHYKIDKKWVPTIRGSGSFDISVSGLDFSINMIFGVDVNGLPTIYASGCSCGVSRVNIKFHGGWAWLYNLFSGKLEDVVKKTLKNKICDSVTKQINEEGEKKLASLPVTVKLGRRFLLDYRLLQTPSFSHLTWKHFTRYGDETEAPFDPPTMVDIGDTQRMMYLWISDYMFNTLGYAAQMHNYLARNITAADCSPIVKYSSFISAAPDQRGILNTTCTSFICLGNLIPQIHKDFPDSTVELNLFSGNPQRCLSLLMGCSSATMETAVNVSLANELVYGKIYDMKLLLNVTNSAVGPVAGEFIQTIINNVLKTVLIPKINELGQKGFPLPVTGKIRFINASLRLLQHAVVIETDLNYTG
ncbi:hypothetical protein ACJMK2_009905 [Sinanodonta woodiana]|uniref:Uncharacterized protein n=1 Tax=Sinanodonta woodiana TaxID=1069815 RepID=A0ABD3VDN8_SINWO